MFKRIPLTLGAAAIGVTGLLGFGATGAVEAAPRQDGLVNVALVDTTVQVPIAVAANICDVDVNVLAAQLAVGDTTCTAGTTATAVDRGDSGGNSNARQTGLVNIFAADTTIQVPLAVAANLCDIKVNVLSRQVAAGDTTCDAVADSGAEG